VHVLVGDGSRGVPEHAPYDGIAVAAAAPEVPPALYEQLTPGGRLVLPRGSRLGQDLVLVARTPTGPVERSSIPCRFVPLVGAEGFSDA
jgi:protein-L-isoaspartate(D-aspartate) O-methyltransferase